MELNRQEYVNEVAARFRSVRSLVKATRKDFCEKHGLSRNTVQGWEVGKNLATKKQRTRFIDALASEGVFCTDIWLLHGQGTQPNKVSLQQSMEMLKLATSGSEPNTDPKQIQAEANYFARAQKKAGQKPITLQISDNAMAPHYERGDFVGGVIARQPESLAGKICIVEASPDAFIVRRLLCDGSRFLLVPSEYSQPVISLEKLSNAARILWHRKPLDSRLNVV